MLFLLSTQVLSLSTGDNNNVAVGGNQTSTVALDTVGGAFTITGFETGFTDSGVGYPWKLLTVFNRSGQTCTFKHGGTGLSTPENCFELSTGANIDVTTGKSITFAYDTDILRWRDVAQNAGGPGTGSVTSVDVSGGTTGLTATGGPVTASGTITLAGTLSVANGGTGQTTPAAAFSALAPSQTGHAGEYLTTDGAGNVSWAAVSGGGAADDESTVIAQRVFGK